MADMSRTGQTGRAAVARLLALLAVVLGLLAMHGLPSTHHVAVAAPGHALSAVAAAVVADDPVLPQDREPRGHDHPATGAWAETATAAARSAGSRHDQRSRRAATTARADSP